MSNRKRAASFSSLSSSGSPKTKDGGERLIDSSRKVGIVRDTFVSGGEESISADLVAKVSRKACEFYMEFKDCTGGLEYYHGQGGFLRGAQLDEANHHRTGSPSPDSKRRKTVAFQADANYEAIPVTAKHNIRNDPDESYSRTTVRCHDGYNAEVVLPDGGCEMVDTITVRTAVTAPVQSKEVKWRAADITFGETISDPSVFLTKQSRLFDKVPDTFQLRVGHKVGLLVYRTFDIDHADAHARPTLDLEKVYGEKLQVCIYAGTVTEMSDNGRTFCHDANTFKGCSGAIIFLLDKSQAADVDSRYYGNAVGINVGGLDPDNNLAFLINQPP